LVVVVGTHVAVMPDIAHHILTDSRIALYLTAVAINGVAPSPTDAISVVALPACPPY
jgi:hypothetical protein